MSEHRPSQEPVTSPQAEYDSLRFVTEESPCPYLPGLLARNEVYYVSRLDGSSYGRLLASGFRRSGRMVYRPRCRTCRECRQLRVSVSTFVPSRSMRRIMRLNTDVRVTEADPSPTREKFDIFQRYLDVQHDRTMSRAFDTFVNFLYDSPLPTREFEYRLGDRLLGSSIADVCADGLSSVYMYFDPDFADRSPGTFSILWEIDHCRRQGLPWYYLGYYIAGSPRMAYKARFRPNQILLAEGRWATFQG